MGLDKHKPTYRILQINFTALKILCFTYSSLFAFKLYYLTFSTFCITFMIRKKYLIFLLWKSSWNSFVKEITGWSFHFHDSKILWEYFQLPWIKAPKGEHTVSVWSIRRSQGVSEPRLIKQKPALPPCLPSYLILFPRAGNKSITASWFWVSAQIKCVPVEMKILMTISLQPLAI